MIDGLIDDILTKVTFITGIPGTPTGPNPVNEAMLATRRFEIEGLKRQIMFIKSHTTKLI